jgi:hypothetical protein
MRCSADCITTIAESKFRYTQIFALPAQQLAQMVDDVAERCVGSFVVADFDVVAVDFDRGQMTAAMNGRDGIECSIVHECDFAPSTQAQAAGGQISGRGGS